MFHDNPTNTRTILPWSLNHSLDAQVSSFKNPTNSRDILLKTLFLTELACGNRVAELTAINREGLSSIEIMQFCLQKCYELDGNYVEK